jgi:hypothetical protein
MCIGGSHPGVKRPGVKLTTRLHLVPRLRIRGAIPPLSQYVFMACCLVKQQGHLYRPYVSAVCV